MSPNPCRARGCGLPAHKGFRFCAGMECSMRHLRKRAKQAKEEEE
jgi:hypothetical protein